MNPGHHFSHKNKRKESARRIESDVGTQVTLLSIQLAKCVNEWSL